MEIDGLPSVIRPVVPVKQNIEIGDQGMSSG
jgi:hypothetical protein